MKKFVLAICFLLVAGAYTEAQEMKFRAVKPLSIVKNTVCYTSQLTGKVLNGVKGVICAPFTTPVPLPEVKVYKYTFPKLKWQRGKLEEVKPAGDPLEWRKKSRPKKFRILSPDEFKSYPADSELLDLPKEKPQLTIT